MKSLLLAGGKSSRMGFDKALFEIEGRPMIEHVAIALAGAGLEPIRIAVAKPSDVDKYGSAIGMSLDIEWVLDSRPHAGPIEAIIEAISDLDEGSGLLQLAPVDYPRISEEVFDSLSENIGASDSLIMPHDGKMSHPLLALIRPREVLEEIGKDRRPLHVQFTDLKHSLLVVDSMTVTNVNTPEDLDRESTFTK